MKTAVSYETVSTWFAKCANNAGNQGKSESATLWRDGLEHLESFRNERNQAIELLREVLNSDMAMREEDEGQKSKLLSSIRKYIKAI